MKQGTFTLAVLLAVGIALPPRVGTAAASTHESGLATRSLERSSSSALRTPLSITLYCTSGLCTANAAGGSGTGYSFVWISAAEISDSNGTSYARPNCYWYGGTVYVSVTVSDSNNSTSTAEYPVSCVEEP